MAREPRVLGIVLAGGEGKRLWPLTADRAKPAVPFGGNYRLIDFALSNLVNAEYRQIVVLTRAPANDAPIGGVKVVADSAWFAARPSGTEDVYKVYAESFLGDEHLERVIVEAQELVTGALSG